MGTWDEIFTGSGFVEYAYFEGDPYYRRRQQKLFIDGDIYAPDYDYPKLGSGGYFVFDKARLHAKRISLKALKIYFGPDKAELYYAKLKRDYKKRLLVEEAEKMRKSKPGSRARELSQKKFMKLNNDAFGKYDAELFYGLINSERGLVEAFEPKDTFGVKTKFHLLHLLERVPENYDEKVLIDSDLISTYGPIVADRYRDVLDSIAERDTKYSAEECAVAMTNSLKAGGLYEYGWRAEIDPAKSVVATYPAEQRIYLPIGTYRTAAELRRLILHEQEVHARRAQNGSVHEDFPLLGCGTAGYTDVEEGLGVFLEAMVAGAHNNPAVERARQRYINLGLALGADGLPRDASQVFDVTWRLYVIRLAYKTGIITEKMTKKAKSQAMVHIENIYRGTDFVSPGVCYTKAKVYYEGLLKNVKRAHEIGGDIKLFDQQFIGKFDHTNKRERTKILRIIT